ncbi:MAG: hypothetical protein OSB21_12935, partial [Myxococcota bacterium]|nr:hypothetical protein [Myxococcota bacterium]
MLPDAVPAGAALRLTLKVETAAGAPALGASVNVGIVAPGFADLVRFPRGATCISDGQGDCELILVSRGESGIFSLVAQVLGETLIEERFELQIMPLVDGPSVIFEIETLARYVWRIGHSDPFETGDVLALNADIAPGRVVEITLQDKFENGLGGSRVRITTFDPSERRESADAGPADSGRLADAAPSASDSGALISDSSVALDAISSADASDVSTASDAANAIDAADASGDGGRGVADVTSAFEAGPDAVAAARDAGTSGDTGAEVQGLIPPIVVQATADGEGGWGCRAGAAELLDGELLSDVDGKVRFCLLAAVVGSWRARIQVLGFESLGPMMSDGFILHGETRDREPAAIVAIGDDPTVICAPGQFSPPIGFRVLASGGSDPVAGVQVGFLAGGGLQGLSRTLATTDSNGEVSVRVACPARLLPGGRVFAQVRGASIDPASVSVRVRADAAVRLVISPHHG